MDPRSPPDQPTAAAEDHTPATFYEVTRTSANTPALAKLEGGERR